MAAELIDTHCHLTSKDIFPHHQHIIDEAVASGVTHMITVVCRAAEAEVALSIRAKCSTVWVAAGIHPHEAGHATEDELTRLAQLWREPGVVAAGEMGLDYHYAFSPPTVQRSIFRRQLELARDTSLPIVIHCREAQSDVIGILSECSYVGRRVVFHCFSGTPEDAAEIRSNGWRTSFTGLITFKNAGPQQQAMLETPDDQIMFETDSPYLSPEPVRKMRPNEPKNVLHTVRFAANLRDQSFDELAKISTANARAFFNIS